MAQGAEERRQGPGRETAERVAVGQYRRADPAGVRAQHDLADRAAGVIADEGHPAEAERREEIEDEPRSPLGRGITDPVDALRHAVRAWLDICVEPEIYRIALVDGPSVLGWVPWREVCQRHVFGLVEALLAEGVELGRIRPQPARPLAHALMGAGDEAALYVAEAADRRRARAEMIEVLDQLIAGVTT